MRVIVAGIAVLAVVASACSSEAGGQAEPEAPADAGRPGDGQQAPERPDLPHSGAPTVEEPLTNDTAPFEREPCSMLTEDQFDQLNIQLEEAEASDARGGPLCGFRFEADGPQEGGGFGLTLNTANPDGLSGVYQRDEMGGRDFLDELEPIESFPAVQTGLESSVETGICDVSVGLRDDLLFVITITANLDNQFHEDPCGGAYSIAEHVVATLTEEA